MVAVAEREKVHEKWGWGERKATVQQCLEQGLTAHQIVDSLGLKPYELFKLREQGFDMPFLRRLPRENQELASALAQPRDYNQIKEALGKVNYRSYQAFSRGKNPLVVSVSQIGTQSKLRFARWQAKIIAEVLERSGIPTQELKATEKKTIRFIATQYITQAREVLMKDEELAVFRLNFSRHVLRTEETLKARKVLQARFESLFQEYQNSIYRYLCGMMNGDVQTAQDLTQEAFLRAYQGLPAVLASGKPFQPRAWLYRIATNVCLSELRHRKLVKWQPWEPFISVFHPSQVATDDPETDVLNKENRKEVQLILNRLHPKHGMVLILREYQDLSYAEIAKVLSITVGAVRMLLWRAREELRQVYARAERKPEPTAR